MTDLDDVDGVLLGSTAYHVSYFNDYHHALMAFYWTFVIPGSALADCPDILYLEIEAAASLGVAQHRISSIEAIFKQSILPRYAAATARSVVMNRKDV